MSSESESESSDSSTGSSSTHSEHTKEVMTALKHNDRNAYIQLFQVPALKAYRHTTHWIPLGINPLANLMAVLFTGLGEEIELEAEDVIEPSEMSSDKFSRVQGLWKALGQIWQEGLAYTCIIAQIALRGRDWTLEDRAFKYGIFYQNIVRMFEDDHEDNWVKETLAWWQESALYGWRTLKEEEEEYVARSAAQRVAKKAAQNQVDVTPGEQECKGNTQTTPVHQS
ncbi:hypothetical protein M413DRAFT_27025 [Hebeloma cylindrosporum]|uniref:Uncharacterized protein n=1 Tax=Hebeloma cylindrosporum TaxID=76867 RepID=A0A0C3CF48_HEBCY|nr:hypothetical protein M413DRAFT_27025 [Hebeloma cylindrosporum h7]